ncbi:hypothetical protein OHA40_33435 [Nocardia sp. NBC_00508]|uniref:hypothetical protein n=1 Tax=Nocardia sp. NBC_00508 TaxID=2975992 RepID=UPI002E810E58|nr:hypothetical protein [Nocardia sp. NBC_00508]WUD66390.1 hypothetical protein OHA40_33435 [Nocardia sp. NBC_00508]
MNDPYSSWAARSSSEEPPLAARYQSAEPIRWHGSMVYPMYTEPIGPAPTTVTVTMVSAAPPAGLRGLGIGLSVVDGYVDLHGRALAGVDAWSDALAAGVGFDVTPTAPSTLVTLTPVWVDEFGTQKSWTGNYGIVVEQRPEGRVVLWCSIGEGPPNFANLVVEVSTAPTVVTQDAPASSSPATTPITMSAPAARSALAAGPPTAPTMPVPRIDAGSPGEPAPSVDRPPADPSPSGNGHPSANEQAAHSPPHRPAGRLFTNLQSSRAARPTPEASQSSLGSLVSNPQPAADIPSLPSTSNKQPTADASHRAPSSLAGNRQPPADSWPPTRNTLASDTQLATESAHHMPITNAPPAPDTSHSAPSPHLAPAHPGPQGTSHPPAAQAWPAQDSPTRPAPDVPRSASRPPAADSDGPFGPLIPDERPAADVSRLAFNRLGASTWDTTDASSPGPLVTTTQTAAEALRPASGPLAVPTQQRADTPVAESSSQISDTPSTPTVLPRLDELSTATDAPRNETTRQSGDLGYRGALYDLGVAMHRRGEEQQACGLWAQASAAGHAGAAYELGAVRYRHGDTAGAESWWHTAAERGEPRAIAGLADLLEQQGKHTEARSWRTYAAEQQASDVAGQP